MRSIQLLIWSFQSSPTSKRPPLITPPAADAIVKYSGICFLLGTWWINRPAISTFLFTIPSPALAERVGIQKAIPPNRKRTFIRG